MTSLPPPAKFATGDAGAHRVIDLGRERALTRLSAIYAAQPGSVDFFVLPSLSVERLTRTDSDDASSVANVGQGADLPASLKISEEAFAGLKPVGSVVSTGEGRASVNFPEVVGRYVIANGTPPNRARRGLFDRAGRGVRRFETRRYR